MDRHRVSGSGSTALVFVHGWLGNGAWWDAQRDHFADRFVVVQIDLGGRDSAAQYADAIRAVTDDVEADAIVLVGHSMSGAYVLEASRRIARARAIVLVDTLKDLDRVVTAPQAQELFARYRADFRSAVEDVLPGWLFAPTTPATIRRRIQDEFLAHDVESAIRSIEPLYAMDVREAARRVALPVRAINSDFTPTNRDANRTYFRDYDFVEMAGTGHYPMLERPADFNRRLDEVLAQLGVAP